MSPKQDLMPYLKALDEGRFQDIDIKDFERQFRKCAAEMGDHLQMKLYNCCQLDINNEKSISTFIHLSKLCYSDESISGFSSMGRFFACAYYISTFLLKQKKYKEALEIYNTLRKKSDALKESLLKSGSCKQYAINFYIQFINSAIMLSLSKNKEEAETSFELALASVEILLLLPDKSTTPSNLMRNMKIYFSNVKHYTDKNARTLYECFMKCLKNFEPNFERTEFLCFYILQMDRGETSTEAKELYEFFQNRIRLFLVFSNEIHLTEQWNVILNFFMSDIKSPKHIESALKAFEKIKKDGSELNLLVMSMVFNYSLQLWWKLHSNDWAEKFSVELVKILFYKFLNPLRDKLGNLSRFCSSSIPSMLTCLSDLFASNLHKIFYTIRLCLKNNISNSLDLIHVLRKAFKMVNKSLKEMTKNECCLQRRQYCWSQGIIHYTNAIEDIFRESLKGSGWEHLRDCSKELICELLKGNFEIPYPWKRVVLLFQRWHHANLKLKDYRESLFVCAVYLTAYPDDAEEALALWLQTKIQMSDAGKEIITIADVLEKDSDKIRELNPKYKKLENESVKKLLLMELKSYNSCTFSNFQKSSILYDSANLIWTQLNRLPFKLEIHERALALSCLVDLTVNSGNTELIKDYEEKCKQTIEKLTKKDKKNSRNLFYAGNLKFSIFQLNLKSIQESEDSLNSTGVILDYLKTQEEEKAKFGDDIDLNLTCDILPSSNNLNVKLDEKYLLALNEIVKTWQEAVKNVTRDGFDREEIKSWLYNVKQVALMYQLIGDYYQGLIAWILFYKIGKIFEVLIAQLLGICYILEECTNVDKCNLIQEAESIADEMAKDEKNRQVVVRYWLTMASKHLNQRNDSDCFRYLIKVKAELEFLKVSHFYVQNGKFWCLTCHFLCLYPNYMDKFQFGPIVDMRAIIYKAFNFINSGIKAEASKSFSQTEYAELLLAFMETNMWAVEYFGVYQQTVFMRFFLEDLYKIAQKLVLPTRTAEILVKLAEIDVLCEKFDDCQIKLNKLKNILMIGSIQYVEPDKSVKEYLSVPKRHPEEAISPRAVSPVRFLDKDTKYRRDRDASPYASEIRRNETKFENLNHPENCQCILCRSILIQLLIIDTLTLDGKCLTNKSQLKKAYFCYRVASENLELLRANRSSQNQNLIKELDSAVTQFTGNLDLKINLTRFQSAKFLINYAFFKLSTGDVATKLIEKIDKILENLTIEEKLLKWVFLELKLTALILAKKETKKASSPVVNVKPILTESISTPVLPHVPRKNLGPNKYKNTKDVKTPRDSKTAGRKLLDESEDEEVAAVKTVKKAPKNFGEPNKHNKNGTNMKALVKASGRRLMDESEDEGVTKTVKKAPKNFGEPNKRNKNAKDVKTLKELKVSGRRLLDESEDEEGAAAPATVKEPINDVSVDLFESFEERLKLTEEPKKKPLLKEKSTSVEIIEVRRSNRNQSKK